MNEWCLAHPFMTFFIILSVIELLGVLFGKKRRES